MYKIYTDVEINQLLSPLDKLTEDIMEFLDIDISLKGDNSADDMSLFMKQLEKYDKLYSVSKNSKLKEHLYNLKLVSIVNDINLKEHYMYYLQNYEIILNCENNKCFVYNSIVQKAFEYIYSNITTMKSFKENYIGNSYSKNILHEYRERYSDERVCPYCDFNELEFHLTSIDHVLPKSKYPLLSIHHKNLIVACTACNDRLKKEFIYFPIAHPLFDNVSDYFNFILSDDLGRVEIVYDSQLANQLQEKAKNSNELFKIKERYNKKINRFKFNLKQLRDKIKEKIKIYENNETDDEFIRSVFISEYSEYIEKQKELRGYQRWTKIHSDLVAQILHERLEIEIDYLSKELNIKIRNYVSNR